MKSHPGGNSISGVRLAALLLVLVAACVTIHGYHYGIEDEAIYLPAIKAHLNPALYPHDSIFFKPQTRPTLFDDLVAASARLLHAPVDWTVISAIEEPAKAIPVSDCPYRNRGVVVCRIR